MKHTLFLLGTLIALATPLMDTRARSTRLNFAPVQPTDIVGVGWSTQVQAIFDKACISSGNVHAAGEQEHAAHVCGSTWRSPPYASRP